MDDACTIPVSLSIEVLSLDEHGATSNFPQAGMCPVAQFEAVHEQGQDSPAEEAAQLST